MLLTLHQYQQRARSTAIYPVTARVIYPALGLAGEFGELAGAIRRRSLPETRKEFGDVIWYSANLCADLDTTLNECLLEDSTFTFHQIYAYTPSDNPYVDAAVDVGRILEYTKKMIRDDAGVMLQPRRENIIQSIASLLEKLASMARCYGFTIQEAAELNLEKLSDRQQRQVLQGDGDNR